MASIGLALLGIKSRLDEHLPKDEIERACRSLGHVWRRRVLDPATTVHLMLLQLLAGVGLCGLRHVSKLAVSAQAVAQARARLPVQLWTELLSRLDPRRDAAPASTSTLWKGLRAWIADGMSFLVPDTPELAGRYGRAMNQRGPSRGYPVPRLLCLLDRASGMIAKALPLPCGRQEHTCLSRLLSLLSAGDPLLGDRGLVSFAHLALLAGNGAAGLFRLPKDKALRRRAGGKQRRVRRLGKQDWLVQWHRTGRPAWMSARRWKQLPQSLVLRQVSFRIRRKGRRDRWGVADHHAARPGRVPRPAAGGTLRPALAGGGLLPRPQAHAGAEEALRQGPRGAAQGTADLRAAVQPGPRRHAPGRRSAAGGGAAGQLRGRAAVAAMVSPGGDPARAGPQPRAAQGDAAQTDQGRRQEVPASQPPAIGTPTAPGRGEGLRR